jgi:hypothetical protein
MCRLALASSVARSGVGLDDEMDSSRVATRPRGSH